MKNSKSENASELGYKPENDGIDHINIHSRGKTHLGRLLSHFAHTPFIHPYYGPFYSMEGFWYYMRSGATDQKLRYLSGFRAKTHGKKLAYVWYDNFKEDIMAANYQKILQVPCLAQMVVESHLPFDHYYTFGDSQIVITPNNYDWLCSGFEDIRTAMQEGMVPTCWENAEKRYLPK